MCSFIQDEKLEQVRDQFFSGELGHGPPVAARVSRNINAVNLSPATMMTRIHERLRNVLERACASSTETASLVDDFEACLERCWRKGKPKSFHDSTILLQAPTVTQRTVASGDCLTTARFYFDAESSSGGFHRLLLHGVCQFHGLQATSTTATSQDRPARLLTVTGKTFVGPKVKLTEHIAR